MSLPHVRGGVSASEESQVADRQSSPRAWGCFKLKKLLTLRQEVFPTCVGVFLEKK